MKHIKIIFLSENENQESVIEQNLNNTDAQAASLLSLIEMNPDIVNSDPEIKAWKEEYDKINGVENAEESTEEEVVVDEEAEETDENEDAVDDEEGEDGKEKKAAKPAADEKKSVTPFSKSKKGADFENVTLENFQDVVKDKFGIDTTKKNWLPTFLASTNKHRAAATKAADAENSVQKVKSFLDSLPAELQRGINAFASKQDWKQAIKEAEPLAYDKPFTSLSNEDKAKAVKLILKKDIAVEDLSKDENKSILEVAENGYNIKVKEIEFGRKSKADEDKASAADFKSRVSASVQKLKTDIPDFDEDYIAEIEDVISNPNKGIGSLFTDKDGKLLPDVAERVAYVLHGKTLLSSATNSQKAKGANEERERIVKSSISDEGSGKGKRNNVTKEEEEILNKRSGILKSYEYTY